MPPKASLKRKRGINAQPARKALKNGELDVDKFLNARQYEIRALEQGMAQSKAMLTKRAFQQVPKDLRRRTASHNVKRVPKRLQRTARREMADDKTPKKGRVGMQAGMKGLKGIGKGKMRLRLHKLQTARKLRELGRQSNRKATGAVGADEEGTEAAVTTKTGSSAKPMPDQQSAVVGRKSKIKRVAPAAPPVAKGKHRKRQAHKSWLPTHLFHAKRAHMTPPSAPLWRFAIPVTPTMKAYRPTHRSFSQRGAIAWDTSYMSTISLEGRQQSLEGVLKGLGFGAHVQSSNASVWGARGERWREGQRAAQDWLFAREGVRQAMTPATVIWSPTAIRSGPAAKPDGAQLPYKPGLRQRKLLLRMHPAAFFEVWEEIVRLAKVAKPMVSVEDLRFEIGSVEVTGPASTEALVGALWPTATGPVADGAEVISAGSLLGSLAALSDPAVLPADALLGLDIQDPRLHHPPRTVEVDQSAEGQHRMLEVLSSWPLNGVSPQYRVFERKARLAAASALPSQKAVNRRKALSRPGEYPEARPGDPSIPVLLHATSVTERGVRNGTKQGSWTVLLPWKCVQPVWYGIQYYPISTGGQPRFGGLREIQQLNFERGVPWFPGDFAGTKGGWEWELKERLRRKDQWERRPKGKRISWEAVDLGNGRKGEVGVGWTCDWERLARGSHDTQVDAATTTAPSGPRDGPPVPSSLPPFVHLPPPQAVILAKDSVSTIDLDTALTTVRITLVDRGTPRPCARIYRLPSSSSDPELRRAWLALGPNKPFKTVGTKQLLPRPPPDASSHVKQQHLAASLLQPPRAGEDNFPVCPDEGGLIGFITTGNYDLGAGKGTAIGNVVVGKVKEGLVGGGKEDNLCIVRNAGEGLARLARWALCE